MRAFVDGLNGLMRSADALSKEDARFGRQARAALRDAIGGARGAGGSTFSRLGVRTDPDNGLMKLDESALRDALTADPAEVASVFGAEQQGGVDRLSELIEKYTDPFSGSIDSAKDALQARRDSIDLRVERGDARLESFEKRMTSQFTAMEQFISEMNDRSTQIASYLPGLYTGL